MFNYSYPWTIMGYSKAREAGKYLRLAAMRNADNVSKQARLIGVNFGGYLNYHDNELTFDYTYDPSVPSETIRVRRNGFGIPLVEWTELVNNSRLTGSETYLKEVGAKAIIQRLNELAMAYYQEEIDSIRNSDVDHHAMQFMAREYANESA